MNMIERAVRATRIRLYALVLTFHLLPFTLAQTNSTFQWGFTNTQSTSLQACASLPISIIPLNGSSGTPPYYMQAFAVGGTPTSTLVSTDGKNVQWKPTHPPGTNLLLSMVDSTGGSGGVDITLYTVIAGQSTDCIVNDNTNDFTISANVTDELTTCQPWGLRIKGGIPPYNLTLAALNSTAVTNVTLPFGDDVFTYIDRAVPGGQLSASISDLTGRWAKGTPLVRTQGSSDVSCPGLVSSSSNSNSTSNSNPTPGPQKSSSKTTAIAIGIAVPVALLLILGGAILWWHRRRRQKRQQHQEDLFEADVYPRQFEETGQALLNPNNLLSSTYYDSVPSLPGGHTPALSDSSGRPISSNVSRPDGKGSVTRLSAAVNEEIVIHHRDGGAVREFPPPYADHHHEDSES
ncbi:hypothetical protein BDQ17DRAFT_1304204 [Cyathus striatus]|nr:hypothetical protein BDQ17DRAFT_1304204 [Cyathus striatus]